MLSQLFLAVSIMARFSFPASTNNYQLGIPAYAPDGRLVISIEGDLWIGFPGVKKQPQWTQLTSGPADDRDPIWAANGKSIVFASNRSGEYDLWEIQLSKKAEPVLLIQSEAADTHPTLGPDGTMVWVRGVGPNAHLWIKRQDQPAELLLRKSGAAFAPVCSPDGRAIAYIAEGDRGKQLRILQLAPRKDTLVIDSGDPEFPSWSPDGQRLVYTTRGQQSGVWITTPTGAYRNLLSRQAAAAVWSPDGLQLALIPLDQRPTGYNGDPDPGGARSLESPAAKSGRLQLLPAPVAPDAQIQTLPFELPGTIALEAARQKFAQVVNLLNEKYALDRSPDHAKWQQLIGQYRAEITRAPTPEAIEEIIYQVLKKRPTLRPEARGKAGISSAHPLATAAGLEILEKGGNVVDAAIAVSFALGVVEPDASGVGGYGEMLIYLQGMEAPICIEFLTRVPEAAGLQNGALHPLPSGGPVAVNIPGTVAGMELAWQRYGSRKVSWAELLVPAIRLAEQGFVLDTAFPTTLEKEKTQYLRYPGSRRLFFRDSLPLQPGDTLRNPDLAWTLQQIAWGGAKAFYQGTIARRLVQDLRSQGNVMTMEDMARYYAVEREPVKTTYRGHTVYSGPPPVAGGALLTGKLNLLEQFTDVQSQQEDASTLHSMIEAWKLTPSTSGRIADPGLWPVDLFPFTDKASAQQRWMHCFQPLYTVSPYDTACLDNRIAISGGSEEILDARIATGTTSFAVADKEGNMVSVTQTLGTWGGNFYVSPGLGFLYNDKLGSYGRDPQGYNARIPYARNVTSISPTLVFKGTGSEQRALLATGAAGNAWITSAVYQIVTGVIDQGLGPQQAIEQPRFLLGVRRDPNNREKVNDIIVQVEDGFAPGVLEKLEQMGHRIQRISRRGELRMGYAAAVLVEDGQVRAGADPRRSGQAGAIE